MPVHVEDITNSGMRAMWENQEGPSSVAPAPCSLAQIYILIVRKANFDQADLESARQILIKF